jgi:hypothetical protein
VEPVSLRGFRRRDPVADHNPVRELHTGSLYVPVRRQRGGRRASPGFPRHRRRHAARSPAGYSAKASTSREACSFSASLAHAA